MSEKTEIQNSEVVEVPAGSIKQYSPTNVDLASAEGVELQAKRIEKYMEVQGRIRRACVKMTNKHDWMDQGGKPYLLWQGASKIAAAFGISYDTPRFTQKIESDEDGQFVGFEVETLVRYQGRSVPEIGTASSRDDLFGVRWVWDEKKKEKVKIYLPLSEVDLNDIKKKALTNLLNRGLKSLLGISYSWEEVKEASGGTIIPENCASANYSKGTAGGKTNDPATADTRSKVWKQIMELADGEQTVAEAKLREYTVWSKDGKNFPGKSKIADVSDAMLKHLEPKVQTDYDKFIAGINAAGKVA